MIYGLAAIAYLSSALPGSAEEIKPQTPRNELECKLKLLEEQRTCTAEYDGKVEKYRRKMNEEISACLRNYDDSNHVKRQRCVNDAHFSAGIGISRAVIAHEECLKQTSDRYDGCVEKHDEDLDKQPINPE